MNANQEEGQPRPGRNSLNLLTRKLSLFAPLSISDSEILDTLPEADRNVPADMDIISEGMAPQPVFVLREGLAIRYRNLPDGSRQIMTFLIPGDLCNPHMFLLKAMDHSIGTITPVRVASIARERMIGLLFDRPRISAALWWSSLQEEAMLRERIVSLGRRDARGRVAYLLCELLWRYAAVGLAEGDVFGLPLTQSEIADTLGLTPVHVNRVLQTLRGQQLIRLEHRRVALLDVRGLQTIAGFNSDYLHLNGASESVARYFDELEGRRGR